MAPRGPYKRVVEKKELEDLSNLVFGLALTLGALTLVAPANNSLSDLVDVLLHFGLSFFVLVFIWYVYNFSIKEATIAEGVFVLNIGLLFLVVIEPFLLSVTGTQSGAVGYAVDIGCTLLILAYIITSVLRKDGWAAKHPDARTLLQRRNLLLLASALFFASVIPIMVLPMPSGVDLASVIWIAVLAFSLLFRSFQRMRG
jgi:uncharacterized membrane protein